MQVEEESPKQYVDIERAPDKEMRPGVLSAISRITSSSDKRKLLTRASSAEPTLVNSTPLGVRLSNLAFIACSSRRRLKLSAG